MHKLKQILHIVNGRRASVGYNLLRLILPHNCDHSVIIDASGEPVVSVHAVLIFHKLTRIISEMIEAGEHCFFVNETRNAFVSIIIDEVERQIFRSALVIRGQVLLRVSTARYVVRRLPLFAVI